MKPICKSKLNTYGRQLSFLKVKKGFRLDILRINDRIGFHPDSYYAASAADAELFAEAEGDISTDVCVVGGGYSGLSAAIHLAQKGFKVTLLEANRLGSGASGRNGGQVGTGQRVEQCDLEKMVGRERASFLWDLGLESVQLVKELIAQSDLDCPFVKGIVHANHRQRYTRDTIEYVEHLQKKYDYQQIHFLNESEIKQEVGSPNYHSGCLDLGSGHLHPLKYIQVLVRLAKTLGVKIYEQSRMTRYVTGDTVQVMTEKAIVKAKYVILGLNGYHNNINRTLESRVMPINNYIVATEPLSEALASSLIPNNYAVCDSRFVINYFRLSDDRRLLFGGGESYRYKFPDDIKQKVSGPMLGVFPQLKTTKIDYAWGGTLGITRSRLPYFSREGNNVLSVAGFSGHGIAMATLAGKIAAEAIDGQMQRFDVMHQLPTGSFPGGALLRYPALVAGMLWYAMLDKL